MRSYLTAEELKALQTSGLDQSTPFVVQGVSRSQLSVSRHYGGCRYQGRDYFYNPVTDELIRSDVLRWVQKRRKVQEREKKAKAMENQRRLF